MFWSCGLTQVARPLQQDATCWSSPAGSVRQGKHKYSCIEKPVLFLHIQSSNHRATQISSSPPPPPEAPGAAWAITYSLFFFLFFSVFCSGSTIFQRPRWAWGTASCDLLWRRPTAPRGFSSSSQRSFKGNSNEKRPRGSVQSQLRKMSEKCWRRHVGQDEEEENVCQILREKKPSVSSSLRRVNKPRLFLWQYWKTAFNVPFLSVSSSRKTDGNVGMFFLEVFGGWGWGVCVLFVLFHSKSSICISWHLLDLVIIKKYIYAIP